MTECPSKDLAAQAALIRANEILREECHALAVEADTLAGLVRRLADNLRRYHINGERDTALLKEARAVLGESADNA